MSPAWWFYKQAVVKCMVKGGKTSVTYDEYTTLAPRIGRGCAGWVSYRAHLSVRYFLSSLGGYSLYL